MTDTAWKLTAAEGELQILTGVGGPAAKMGHRLTIAFAAWQAEVHWRGDDPVAARLVVDVDSLQVLRGEGGVTPLTGPEKGVVRSNALKSLDAKKYPAITFVADDIDAISTGYRLTGTVEIHGKSRPQSVDLAVEDAGDTWVMTTSVAVVQSQFAIKPYSLFMGTLKVADEVTLRFTARHAK
ncbi:YceI family protein [Mycobacterium sp. EPa45]|uniref:YceI family protein n=1 Tax=Mycobacterium sp. EPa45 TaxID=1545728 RepID=UPI000642525F|nr:YceI family protein [Mycobacterium sp. EPa45]AKK28020.1 S-adenosyl-L-methionine-dependent methyltransferase [Mycobacterium sp. EPa45]